MGAIRLVLDDGSAVHVRAVQRDDVPLVEEMHRRLSRETIYHRYFAATTPPRREIERLCTLAQGDGTVYVVTAADDHQRMIGIACYAQQPTCWGELAILIEDAYQGRGLGRKLLRLLTRHATAKGIETMDVNILPSNGAMLHLARNSGRPHRERYLDGMQQVRLALQ